MILLCYDGSADAQAAIDRAGELFPGQPATVLVVWEPIADVMARTAGFGLGAAGIDMAGVDAETQRRAGQRAEEGMERARQAGLDPHAHIAPRGDTIAEAIIDAAEEVGAVAIVLGTRGLGGLKSLFLGSVSHAVLQRADRPVVVVPSAEVAAERRERG